MKAGDLPVEGRVRLPVPVEQVWDAFLDVRAWPTWNPCFFAARVLGGTLEQGSTLVWAFNPIRPAYLYKMPVVAKIVEFEAYKKVTWEVKLPGFHAHHSYLFERISDDECEFGSWETAEGPLFTSLRAFWMAHFRFVRDESLNGALHLVRHRSGVRLRRYGTPTSETPLVVVPGIDGSPGSVLPLVEGLAERREVIVVDYTAEQNASLEDLSREIADLVEREVQGPVDILGQSLGSIMAAQVSGMSDAVRRTVLVGTFLRLRSLALRISNALSRVSGRRMYRATAAPLMAAVCGPVGDGGAHPFFATSKESDPEGVLKRTEWEIGRDFTPDLEKLKDPSLVLLGANDRFAPGIAGQARELQELLDGRGRVRLLPNAGHVLLPSAAVREALTEIEAFLA